MKKRRMVVIFFLLVAIAGVAAFMVRPAFGRLPRGERMERIRRSPNFRDGEFRNQSLTAQMTSDKGMLGMMWDFIFSKRERLKPVADLPVMQPDLHSLDREGDVLVWFGHSSYFIQTDGKRFLVDPVLTDKIPMSLMFNPFKGTGVFSPDDIPEIDYLIVTHDHWDHLDYETVKSLKGRIGKVICPLGVGEHFEYWGFDRSRLIEMDWDEEVSLPDGFAVYCLPSRHFSGRSFSRNRTLWASFLLETPSQRIYMSGDGGYDKHFAEIAERFGPIDLAIMENGQYNEDWRYIHLMPDDLKRAVSDLHAGKVLTVHNSKFALSRHAWDDPLKHAYGMKSDGHVHLLTPVIGERVLLNDTAQVFSEWWKGID
ncbi:MAG: MBL fold metallo-hydrolase [Bacteroidales bacterium]|nr:MBL fold metallo-hydrolase [Bacteroidales bacterium]